MSKLGAAAISRGIAYVDPRHPVTQTLTDVFGGYVVGSKKPSRKKLKPSHDGNPGRRAEIASEKLCDDVIAHLAPSLEPYKGCTLFDVHPGACLWSAKLHDYLKPKRHVLMEPEQRYFEPFIKPLLDKPGSTYRHTPLTGAHPSKYWENYRAILDDPTLMPEIRPTLEESDPKTRQLDTSVLLTGNLFRRYEDASRRRNAVDYAPLVLQHMSYAALANDIIHRNGLVRMLWWLPEDKKRLVFDTSCRSKYSLPAAVSISTNVTEVAGAGHLESPPQSGYSGASRHGRSQILDEVVRSRVESRMKEANLEIERTKLVDPKPSPHISPEDIKAYEKDITATKCRSLQDLAKATEDYEAHMDILSKDLPVWRKNTRKKIVEPVGVPTREEVANLIAYPQALSALFTFETLEKEGQVKLERPKLRAAIMIDNHFRLINLECEYAAVAETHPNDPDLPTLRIRILAAGDRQQALEQESISPSMSLLTSSIIEEIMALYYKPGLLNRDTRAYEPLRTDKTDFWPNYELALLDLTPKTRDIGVPDVASRRDAVVACKALMTHLYTRPKEYVDKMLTQLAYNAAEDLIPMVPALYDARMGGRMDPTKVRVRGMGEEAVAQLVKAFVEWPFRPTPVEMALASEDDTSSGSATAAEDEGGELD